MNVLPTDLPGVRLIEPRVFADPRGCFFESYNRERFAAAGIPDVFVQDNHSVSQRGVLRGLHLQVPPHAQAKLVRVVVGEVWDVAVDLRRGSPTWGCWQGFHLSAANRRLLYVPAGFAHGFCVLSETAEFLYKCSDGYAPDCERGIAWDDPDLAIAWPVREPLLSDRDRAHGPLAAFASPFVYEDAPA